MLTPDISPPVADPAALSLPMLPLPNSVQYLMIGLWLLGISAHAFVHVDSLCNRGPATNFIGRMQDLSIWLFWPW